MCNLNKPRIDLRWRPQIWNNYKCMGGDGKVHASTWLKQTVGDLGAQRITLCGFVHSQLPRATPLPCTRVGANRPIYWFLEGKGLGIQQGTNVWVGSPKSCGRGWGETTHTVVPWRQGFRHPTRN